MVKYLEKADMLLFAYPVYTFIAPSQLHRFIELMKASGISFEGKYADYMSKAENGIQNFMTSDGVISVGIHRPGFIDDLDCNITKKGINK